ncbi:MAG: 16S rRNA (guanine(527)-N(7))-methyltransferase RsmG [Alphaproteobacteria bacterium]|nr:16S rRNA (guanine(527)-N(7))-methyltransferase RsmG [Alphaproteobacteria bacterium]MCW5741149.1 16S rRNA (guanine(527)-N(7))-methyltransferase RsmG [Alphaproteobacteria bacterium]
MKHSAKLQTYAALLRKWQRSINLVGRSTLDDLERRHFDDSLQLLGLLPENTRTLIDLGSGAGFPGLVIAAERPEIAVTLVEADQRKAAFLIEVARAIAPNASVKAARIEALEPFPVDVVTARALAPLPKLLAWAAPFATDPAICLFHKGVNVDSELTEAARDWMMDVQRVPSATEPGASILRISRLRPRA